MLCLQSSLEGHDCYYRVYHNNVPDDLHLSFIIINYLKNYKHFVMVLVGLGDLWVELVRGEQVQLGFISGGLCLEMG